MSAPGTGQGGVPGQIADALQSSSDADIEKVGIALGVFLAASLATLVAFELLRPNNKIVYEPKRKYADLGHKAPPHLGYKFLGWIKPVWSYPEADMMNDVGLDAVTFLRFLRLCCWITTALAVVLGATLIPVDLVWNLKYAPDELQSKGSALSILSLAEMSGSFLYAHVIMSYFAVAIALFFIFRYYKHMVTLRWEYFRSEEYQNSFHARTLMLTDVPRKLQSDNAITSLLSSLGLPYPTTEVHIGRVVGSLPELIEKHDDFVRDLEHVLAKYLKNAKSVPDKRPTIRIKKSMGMFGGETVDAIDYYTAQINRLENAIESWRDQIAEKKPESYGFASLAAVPYAHAAAKTLKEQGKKQKSGVTIELAPRPRDIIWKNLVLSKAKRASLSTTGFLYLIALLFVNAVPLLAVALIAQMASFTGYIGFLGSWQDSSNWSFALVAGLVPPLISGVMGYFLPIFMRKIAKYRGEQTRTKLDKVVTGQYFGFLVVSQFIFFSLIGVFVTSIATVVSDIIRHDSAGSIFGTLQDQTVVIKKQFLNMSNYWLTWMPLRLWMSTFDLAQGIKLLLVWVQKSFFGRTPRDVREYTKPPNFEYAIYYANFLFVFAVGAIYGVLAPLVMIFTACVFWVSLACYKYQFMYVSISKVESGGQLWRVIVNRLLASLVLMQLILMFVVALDSQATLAGRIVKIVLCLPPVAGVVAFKVYCRKRFDRQYDYYIPQGEEMAAIRVHKGDERHHRLERRFGHPSLHQKLFVPMVHANIKHLLPEVYRGRLEEKGPGNVDGRKVDMEEVAGGLKIASVDEDQLEYDPKTDSDTMSIMSQSTLAMGGRMTPSRAGTGNTFADQYQQYLAGANMSRGNLGEVYELNEVRDSHDNLLEKYGNAPPYSSQHSRRPSGATMYSGSGTPGLEYPPGTVIDSDLGRNRLGHYQNNSQYSLTSSTNGYFAPQGPRSQPTQSPYYNAAAQYHAAGATNASGPRPQPSINSLGGQYRSESPLQISPQMGPTHVAPQAPYAGNGNSRSASPAFGPTRGSPQHQAYRVPPPQGASQSPAPGSIPYYNSAAMYAGPPAPPQQQQGQRRQGTGGGMPPTSVPYNSGRDSPGRFYH